MESARKLLGMKSCELLNKYIKKGKTNFTFRELKKIMEDANKELEVPKKIFKELLYDLAIFMDENYKKKY